MKSRVLVVSLFLATLWTGCYAQHGIHSDDGGLDTGLRDASADHLVDPACPWLGPYRPCGGGCAHDPLGIVCSLVGEVCDYEFNLCFPVLQFDPRGSDGCAVGHPDPHPDVDFPPVSCWNGKLCLTQDPSAGGFCVDDSTCRLAPDYREGMHCVYSDGTLFENGPPYPDACPSPADARTPFCGGPCGECPVFDYGGSSLFEEAQSGCVALSETRGLGVCTMFKEYGCARGDLNPLGVFGQFDAYGLGVPACLVLLDPSKPDGLSDFGAPTMAASCRAYLARFPDAPYACLDQDWHRIP